MTLNMILEDRIKEEQRLYKLLAISRIPDYMHEPLVLYVVHRIQGGSFLTAVLSNDLTEACACADDNNKRCLFDYINFLYNNTPRICWGSPEKVQKWLQERVIE